LILQVVIQQNATCSGWIDTCDLIQAHDLDVFDDQGNPAHETYLDALEEARADKPHLGTSLLINLNAIKIQKSLLKL
jgi:hypothetical protein